MKWSLICSSVSVRCRILRSIKSRVVWISCLIQSLPRFWPINTRSIMLESPSGAKSPVMIDCFHLTYLACYWIHTLVDTHIFFRILWISSPRVYWVFALKYFLLLQYSASSKPGVSNSLTAHVSIWWIIQASVPNNAGYFSSIYKTTSAAILSGFFMKLVNLAFLGLGLVTRFVWLAYGRLYFLYFPFWCSKRSYCAYWNSFVLIFCLSSDSYFKRIGFV